MTGFLDTNVIVRYLTGDPPDMASRAASILDGERELLVTAVVIAESAYILGAIYRRPRSAIVDALISLIRKENVSVFGLDESAVLEALILCRPSNRVSFADAMTWATARSSESPVVYSFDRRFPGIGIEVRDE